MTKLSVNVNKIATLRNARGGNIPNVLKVTLDCESFGAEGITVHPRPDERHIRYADVYELRPAVSTEFNIEGYPSEKFLDMVLKVKPTQVTLVPDAHDVITSNAGWDTKNNFDFLSKVVDLCKSANIRTSIFVEPDLEIVEYAAKTDLSLENLRFLHERIPFLSEVSIGHCLICDALYLGLRETIKQYKECLK